MKKLHRYIFGEIFTYFLLCLFLLTFLLLVNRLFQLTDLVINKGVAIATVGKLLMAIMPVFLIVTLPMSVLVACILVFSRLSSDNEFLAMTASGMSLHSQLIPVASVGLLSAALSAFLMFYGLPWSHQTTSGLRTEILQGRAASFEIKEQVFNDGFEGIVIYVRKIDAKSRIMRGVLISDTRNPEESQVIFADRGLLVSDPSRERLVLRLTSGTLHKTGSVSKDKKKAGPRKRAQTPLEDNKYQVIRFGAYDVNLDLRRSLGNSKALRVRLRALPLAELRRKIAQLPPDAPRRNAFLVEFHKKFAGPVVCLILALLGAPLGVQHRRSGRHGGFALSLAIVFLYYIFATFSSAMGENGTIPPMLAVWLPNALLLLVALWAIRKVIRHGTVDIFGFLLRAAARLPFSDRLHPKTA
ncbi:MAG: LptF/LptG family permease [bacterium]